MKNINSVMTGLVSCVLAFGAQARTLALYTFADGVDGAEVAPAAVVNKVADGTAYEVTVSAFGKEADGTTANTTKPMFTNDVPGRYIYDSRLGTNLIAEATKAVYFHSHTPGASLSGCAVTLKNLGRDIGNSSGFTIEAYVKYAAANTCTWRDVYSFQAYNGFKMCNPSLSGLGMQNTSIVNKGGDQMSAGCSYSGVWRHVAVTCSNEEYRAKFYIDGDYKGYVTFTNNAGTVLSSGNFNLGAGHWANTEAMFGSVACLRVSDRVLTPVEFMAASDEPLDPKRTDATLGFWDFRDGAPGTAVTTLANAAIPGVYEGRAVVTNKNYAAVTDSDAAPRFSDDRPGENLYNGRTGGLYAREPQSVELRYTTGLDRGFLLFPALSRQLSMRDSFTVETFAKVDSRQTASQLWAVLFTGGPGEIFKLCLPGLNNSSADFQNVSRNTTARKAYSVPFGCTGWHHHAAVYDAQTGRFTYYFDYQKAGDALDFTRTPCSDNAPFLVGGEYKANAPHFTGTYNFFGKVCGLRVTASALGTDDFLRAAGSAETLVGVDDGATVHWALDEDPAFTYGRAVNRADLDPTRLAWGRVENWGDKPQASTEVDADHPYVFSGSKRLHRNRACASFAGGRLKEDGVTFDTWKGDALRWDSATNAWRNPKSFTVELFARSTNAWINTNTSREKLIMGREGAGTMGDKTWYFCWHEGQRVAYATNWCRHTWRLMMANSGALVLETKWHSFVDENHDGTNDVARITDERSASAGSALGVNMRDGKWHHIAFTYDDDTWTAKVFFDHREVMSIRNESRGLARMECCTEFGRGLDRSGFDGFLDEIRLTPRALQPGEMLYLRRNASATIVILR